MKWWRSSSSFIGLLQYGLLNDYREPVLVCVSLWYFCVIWLTRQEQTPLRFWPCRFHVKWPSFSFSVITDGEEGYEINDNELHIRDLRKGVDGDGHNAVYQCLASNEHGELWTNFYLNILGTVNRVYFEFLRFTLDLTGNFLKEIT